MAVTKKRNTLRNVLITLLVVAVVCALCAVFAFVINKWSVTITLKGEEAITLEYGDPYRDAGAEARFHGSLIFPEGWAVDLSTKSNVDDATLGSYTVFYTAEAHNCQGFARRTVTVVDTQAPEITLTQIPGHYTLPGHPYEEEGFSAQDNYDGDLTELVSSYEEDGKVYYSVQDSSGNTATAVRDIFYDDPISPELTLEGDAEMTINAGSDFTEPGFSAEDNCDGDLTEQVTVEGEVNTFSAGDYELAYSVSDAYGNTTTAVRTVTVQPLRQPDVVSPDGKVVYLTFDDGPGKYTQQLLDVLEKYNVKVTFFTVNTGYSSLMQKEAAAGHSVAIHSATHDYSKIYASEEAFFADLQKQQDLIYDQTGVRTTLLRFPGGSSNTVSRKYCPGIMTALTKDATDMGFQYFDWNVDSGDAGGATDAESVFQNVIAGIQRHNVSIVLQHDIKGYSVDAVEKIIVWGLAHGYTFLPLTSSSPTAHQGVNN